MPNNVAQSIAPDGRHTGDYRVAAGAGAGSASVSSEAELHQLLAREYPGLQMLLVRRLRDPELAKDLLNDAVCVAWEKCRAGQVAHPEQIAGYVYQVALNLLRNHRRSVADRADRRADARILDGLTGAPEPDTMDEKVVRQVLRIVQGLQPVRDRVLIVRFYLEEADSNALCAELDLTPAQFAKVLHRARRRLRELLESRGIRGGDLFSALLCVA